MKKSVKRSRRAIIVLGMHRSGTSALARTLNLCGVDLGSSLMPPGPEDNVKGFWEHMDIYQTNEKLLEELNSSWDDVRSLPEGWRNSDAAQRYKLEIISILERDFFNSSFWGVKDPRICRFLPLWRPLLEQTGSKPHFLIIVRNPLEVVSSLAKREGFSKGKSCLLWLKHLMESEKGTRNSSRIFVTYEELLSDWKGLMSRVQRFFRFRWPNTLKKAGPEIDAFLENSLRHNRVTDSILIKDKSLSKWIKDSYLALTDTIPNGDGRLIKTLDAIETELKETSILYEPAFTDIWKKYLDNNDRLRERNQQVNDIKNRIEELGQEKRYLQSSIDQLQTYINEKNEHIQQLDVGVKGLTTQLAERDEVVTGLTTQLAERDEAINGLNTQLTEQNEAVAGLTAQLTERDETVEGLSTQLTERDEKVEGLSTKLAERDETLEGLTAQLTEQDEKVNDLRTQLTERDEKVEGLNTQLTERDEKVNGLTAQLAEQDEKVEELNTQLTERDEKVNSLTAQLTEQDEKVEELNTQLTERDEKVNSLTAQLTERDEKITDLTAQIAERDNELNYILNSNSWRLTRSLRAIRRWLITIPNRLLRRYISSAARAIWDNLPISVKGKLKFKNILFRMFPVFFKHTIAYHDWKTFNSVSTPQVSTSLQQETSQTILQHVTSDEEYIYRAYRRPEEQASYKPEEKSNTNPPNTTTKLLAFYFPQYHPFEENDKFWGKGFTEWTSTTKALPLFEGQYQPRLPGELGFYDTRIKEVMIRQIELAKQHGIYGFCFHHYFFDGKPVMRVPFNQIMTNKDLDIPFCLHWANEPWTIRWDGFAEKGGVLLDQHHTPEDDFLFFKDIEPALKDERYIRINNRPLLIIYRPSLFPDIKSTIKRWRELGHKSGIGELFLAVMQTGFDGNVNPRDIGFDAAIEYPPHNIRAVNLKDKVNLFDSNFQGSILSYSEMVKGALERPAPDYKLFRGVMPDWDCTPRRRNPDIFIGSSPEKYQRWLEGACSYTQKHLPTEERFIFINAWNEWAEGAYLEPDQRYGYAYLNATAKALINKNSYKLAVVIHIYYTDLISEFVGYLKNIPFDFDLYVSTTHSEEVSVRSELETNFPDKYILVKGVSNTGFDVAPFLLDFKGVYDKYDLICKVHSKKSLHWDDHHIWRRYLMENLLGSKYIVEKIIDSFKTNPNLGVLFPENFPSLKGWIGWGENFKKAKPLLKKMGIKISEEDRLEYPASTMFWFRPDALTQLYKLKLKKKDFTEKPQTKRDGTLAHTLERLVLLSTVKQGYTWEKALFTKPGQKSQNAPRESSKINFGKIAVVTHLFYTDLLNEFIIYYKNIPCKFDLFLSTIPKKVEYVSEKLKTHFPNHKIDVRGVVNKGRDMAPFVVEFSRTYKQYDIICFTHTKKSDYNAKYNYLDWRRYLLDNILGSQYDVENILSDFQKNPKLGLLFPEYFPPISDNVEWGSNFEMSSNLLSRMNISITQNDKLEFPAGSMFWFRPQALAPLFNIGLTLDDFEELSEKKTDGTLAHAIERLPVFIAEHQGFKCKKVMFKRYSQSSNVQDPKKTIVPSNNDVVYSQKGYCPVCLNDSEFESRHAWLRDHYRCINCNSLPRERALFNVLNKLFPSWEKMTIHEAAPANGHFSTRCIKYSSSQFYPHKPLGEMVNGFRNENIEKLTFNDDNFDYFVCLDVLEHIFDPEAAVKEMLRVVKPGGAVIFTVPIQKELSKSIQRSKLDKQGQIIHLLPADYHGNPIGDGRSLVTWDYGKDFYSLLKTWSEKYNVKVTEVNEQKPDLGIEGDFLNVFVLNKFKS